MTAAKAPLATLLVISAIDLLLCCFTMGVMLFLIFQPSQRSDLSRGQLQARTDQEPVTTSGVGALNSPIVIVVENIGANPLRPFSRPEQFKLVSQSAQQNADTTIFTALGSGGLPDLILQSNTGTNTASTSAKVSVAVQGHLFHKPVHCDHGARVVIDLDSPTPINDKCDPVTTLCPLNIGQPSGEFSVLASDLDPLSTRLLLIPQNGHPKIAAPPLSVCLLGPTYDPARGLPYSDPAFNGALLNLAKECDPSPTNATEFATEKVAVCVENKLRASGKTIWRGSCPDTNNFAQNNARAYFLFVRSSSGSDGCSQVSITQ